MKQIAGAILLGILIVGTLSLLMGQMPSILPMSPVYQTLVLLRGARISGGQYIGFGSTYGASGYGIRDNAGTMEYKNSGGAWAGIGTGGGASAFTSLTDVPASFSGASGNIVAVNFGESALEFVADVPKRTTTNATYTVGAGQDFPTIEAAVATLPDYIDHAVILDIKNGTTITTDPVLSHLNGHGSLSIQAMGSDGHQNTTAAGTTYISSPYFGSYPDDMFNDCWILIVDGTGTDNGFVKIIDEIQSTSRAIVTAWPGTQPDATSLFIVVGALFSPLNAYDLSITNCSLSINVSQCGFISLSETCYNGILVTDSSSVIVIACGFYQTTDAAIHAVDTDFLSLWTNAFVDCNAGNNPDAGAFLADRCSNIEIGAMCYFTSNHICGARLMRGGYADISGNYGTGNGTWGVYATAGILVDEDLSDDYFTGLSGPIYREDIFGIWQTSNSIADNSVFDTGIAAFFGELIVKDETTAVSAVYRVDGGATPILISAHTNFSTTKDTDNKINIYFDVTYRVQNCNAMASIINCAFSGMK